MSHPNPKNFRSRLVEVLLHLGFALTGVGTVLLGSILPRISAQWHLRDKDAGLLLLVQFASSASGALLVRRNLWKTLACGYALLAAGGAGIFLLQPRSLPAFAIFGLGLGLAITSTNLLTSQRYPNRRGAALAILNFSWSAGAVACPLLVAQFMRHAPVGAAFEVLGLLVVPFAFLPLVADHGAFAGGTDARPAPSGRDETMTIVYFALLAFLYVGVESSVGNWTSTYATRVTASRFAGGSAAIATFWAALLLGRAMAPTALLLLNEQRLYRICVAATIVGICMLLAAHHPAMLLAGSGLTGLALAPTFPLIIALFLHEIRGSLNAGWVFAVAGFGGAVCSWLTGMVSSATGSLRMGLVVPGAAALVMAGMTLLRIRPRYVTTKDFIPSR